MFTLHFLRFIGCLAVVVIGVVSSNELRAVPIGQDDTFQDGTVANWMNGGTMQPMNIATGGPLGANDRFMELTADGAGANGRLTVFNRSQWLGDYIAAGVTEIDLDLNNFSSVSLSIRLAFKSATFNGAPGYVTTSAVSLNSNSGWQHAMFFITPGTMTAVGDPSAFATFFTVPAEFRIINANTTGDLNGNTVVGQLGIDNIVAVPEPESLGLMIAGMGSLVISRRRRKMTLCLNAK